MSAPFFITGLPRSRTAWLANLFTTDRSFCHHDLSCRVGSLKELLFLLRKRHVGDSDSGLMAIYPQLIERLPDSPWVLVRRDFDLAWESLSRFLTGTMLTNLTDEVRMELRQSYDDVCRLMLGNPKCLIVDFTTLANITQIDRVWRHCLPDLPFDVYRAQTLEKFHVELKPEHVKLPRDTFVKSLLCQAGSH